MGESLIELGIIIFLFLVIPPINAALRAQQRDASFKQIGRRYGLEAKMIRTCSLVYDKTTPIRKLTGKINSHSVIISDELGSNFLPNASILRNFYYLFPSQVRITDVTIDGIKSTFADTDSVFPPRRFSSMATLVDVLERLENCSAGPCRRARRETDILRR